MAFFPRFASGDFAPLFRLLDDYDVHRSNRNDYPSSIRSFAPRFDVSERKDAYHLDGELPGIDQKDIEIEFTDPHTLVIKGRTARNVTSSNDNDVVDEASSTSSRQATVEDEDAEESSKAPQTQVAKPTSTAVKKASDVKYWVSERSVGEFSRTFNFPTRVDQDAVKASLKDGILSIIVPKALASTAKRITIE